MASRNTSEFCQFDIFAKTFKEAATSAQHILNDMLATLKTGVIPLSETVTSFNEALKDLQAKYDDMYNCAASILEGKLPAKGDSLCAFEEAVSLHRAKIMSHLREAELILKTFLSVEAKAEEFMAALQEARSKAELLLQQIHENTVDHETLDGQILPYRLFLKAVNLDEDTFKNDDSILDELDEYFPRKAVRSLALKRYFLPIVESSVPVASLPPQSLDRPRENSNIALAPCSTQLSADETVPVLRSAMDQTIIPVLYTEEFVPNSTEDKITHSKNDSYANEGAILSSFVESPMTKVSPSILSEDEYLNVSPTSDKKSHTIAVAEKASDNAYHGSYDDEICPAPEEGELVSMIPRYFNEQTEKFLMQKFKSGRDLEYVVLFQFLSAFGIITEEQLCEFAILCGKAGKKTKTKISSAIRLLVGKGYIRRTPAPEHILTISETTKACVLQLLKDCGYETPSPITSLRKYREQEYESTFTRALATNECLLRYLQGIKKKSSEVFKLLIDYVMLYNAGVKVLIAWQEDSYLCNIALENQSLEAGKYWLFVPQNQLPELHDLPEDTLCFAFVDGFIYRWENKENNWSIDHLEEATQEENISSADESVSPEETDSLFIKLAEAIECTHFDTHSERKSTPVCVLTDETIKGENSVEHNDALTFVEHSEFPVLATPPEQSSEDNVAVCYHSPHPSSFSSLEEVVHTRETDEFMETQNINKLEAEQATSPTTSTSSSSAPISNKDKEAPIPKDIPESSVVPETISPTINDCANILCDLIFQNRPVAEEHDRTLTELLNFSLRQKQPIPPKSSTTPPQKHRAHLDTTDKIIPTKTFDSSSIQPLTSISTENSSTARTPVAPPSDTPIAQEAISTYETIAQVAERLSGYAHKPSDAELHELINRLLKHSASDEGKSYHSGYLAQALMLAQASVLDSKGEMPRCERLYEQLKLATGIPSTEYQNDLNEVGADNFNSGAGYRLNQFFSENCSQSLILAAYLNALFAPGYRDYSLQGQAEGLLRDFDSQLPLYTRLKPLFSLLCEIQRTEPCGFTPAVLNQLEDEKGKNDSTKKLQRRAHKLQSEPNIKTYMHGIPELRTQQFGIKSDFRKAMDIIAQNDSSQREFIELLISDYCRLSGEGYVLDEKILKDTIDNAWGNATKGLNTQRVQIQLMARRQIRQAYVDRIELMRDWLENAAPATAEKADKLRRLQTQLLQELDKAPTEFCGPDNFGHYPGVVLHMLTQLKGLLQKKREPLFSDALRTGCVSLDDRFQPIFYEGIVHVRYFEPWRRVLLHITQPNMTVEQARLDICTPESPLFDNLQQLKLITEEEELRDVEKGEKRGNDLAKKFIADLELDYAMGRITEQDKEDLGELIFKYQEEFFETKDFGNWKQFLGALLRQKNDKVETCRSKLKEAIAMRHGTQVDETVLRDAEHCLDDGQFAMAEEYLNIFDSRDKEYEEELRNILTEDNEFSSFLKNFDILYEECRSKKSKPLVQGSSIFLEKHFPTAWTDRHKKDSRQFLSKWPMRKGMSKADDIMEFIKALGIDAYEASKLNDREEVFELKVRPKDCNLSGYRHPISSFGTKLMTPLSVVTLFGNHMPKELESDIKALRTLNPNGTAIVLLDYPLPKDQRQQLAEICHRDNGVRFIVIDRVLALYLALHEQSERLSAMLYCTLPYAAAPQPFLRETGKTPEEMFCGRFRELDSIRDLDGATLVYGGRQLGKTALLQRVQSLTHMPKNKDFAIFCDIKNITDEAEITRIIIAEINNKTNLALTSCSNLSSLCEQIKKCLLTGQIQTMRLMLDEVDAFLRSIQDNAYAPLRTLINLKRDCPNFKFVLAGLNNVYRTRKATMDNGDFGQLGQPLCIKPLSPNIALRFLIRPLRYLGFQPDDGDDRLKAILSSTNYYPGILHLFGYTLTQLLNGNYSLYFKACEDNPPFQLKQELLSAAATTLNENIKEKFLLSLKLDERYHMLARCIGMLYYYEADMHDRYKGYTMETIRNMAESYSIYCLANLSSDEFEALLDEMAEMGILHRTDPGVYRLRRRSLLDIIGGDMDKLEAEIIDKNERGRIV